MSPFNKLVKAKYGYCLYNPNDCYIGRSIALYGEFSELEAALFRQICKMGDSVMEVGANIGTHTQVFSRLVGKRGKVLAFEPQRVVFQTLCANMALNSIVNVLAYQMALGENEGEVRIPPIDYSRVYNYGGISVDGFESGERVPLKRLDDFLDDIDRLRLIKVDVEGMELQVLKGAQETIKTFSPILYVENDRIEKSESLLRYIDELGYDSYWHLPRLYNPDNYAKNSENVFGDIVSVNLLCLPKESRTKVEAMQKADDFTYHPMRKDA